ncbi:MAG: hypothetical protein SchgKO_10750 [Schleiferiaceae bacterium]
MKQLILTLALIISLPFMGRSQTYYTSDIVDSCRAVFARTFGEESLEHYQFLEGYYFYTTWWGGQGDDVILESENDKIRNFKTASALVIYQHPELDTFDLTIYFSIDFWDSIHPIFNPDTNKIPPFARRGEPCKWMFESEIEAIQDTLVFEKKISKKWRNLSYDDERKQYVWRIDGRYGYIEGYTLYERFVLDVVTGEVLAHEYFKRYREGHWL